MQLDEMLAVAADAFCYSFHCLFTQQSAVEMLPLLSKSTNYFLIKL